MLRADVFLVELAQRDSDRPRRTLHFTDRHLGQPVALRVVLRRVIDDHGRSMLPESRDHN